MKPQILLSFLLLCFHINLLSQQTIWSETFDVAEKGYWGDGVGNTIGDMTGITKWTLDVSACNLADAADYIKTVSTLGGRMQAVDINGEAVWASELIDISAYPNANISVNVSETGSSESTDKYIKLFYKIDGGNETAFDTNSENIGNFGSAVAAQTSMNGSNLRIIIRVNNPNAGDACIFDNVIVSYDNLKPEVLSVSALSPSNLRVLFSEQVSQIEAENINNYSVTGIGSPLSATLNADKTTVDMVFASTFTENQTYTLNVSGIIDLNGNLMNPAAIDFDYQVFSIKSFYVFNQNEIYVEFNHALNASSAQTVSNYMVNNGMANPVTAFLISEAIVRLTFTGNFTNNTGYQLTINNLIDVYGVPLNEVSTGFSYHQPQAFDIVIYEIMVDPNPSVGLPEYEYVELFNRTAYDICLYNWKVKVGTSNKTVPLQNIKANSYLIVTSSQGAIELSDYGTTVGILGSTDLTNSGKEVALVSNTDLTIDSLSYTDKWYQNTQKDDGGWSMERIDPDNTCSKISNWRASTDISGGTPGRINSVDAPNIDNSAPQLLSINVYASNEIRLTFNEEIHRESVANLNNFLLNGSVLPNIAYLVSGQSSVIALVFNENISEGGHQLSVSNVKDACGNVMEEQVFSFSNYKGYAFDIVINELMVDVSPAPGVLPAAKYIELYNRSTYTIDITGWFLQIGINDPVTFSSQSLNSNDYLIICPADETEHFSGFGKVLGLLNESQLTTSDKPVLLFNRQGELIDYVKYSDTWYGNSEKSNGGWSLERIDATNFCGETQNWTASNDFKGGTPGSINSVNKSNPDTCKPVLQSIRILSSYKLALNFSKNITSETVIKASNYLLDNGANFPVIINFSDTSRSTIILQFAGQFIDGQEQSISIINLADYCGNVIDPAESKFTYHRIYPKGAFAESDKMVHIVFSEEVELISAQTVGNYNVNLGIGNPINAYRHSTRSNEVYLEFTTGMNNGQSYSIHIESIKDMYGNFLKPVDLNFIFYEPSSNDLVINEILFNPRSTGVDFIELYNRSIYPIDLSKLSIATRDEEGVLESVKKLSTGNMLLEASHFLAISTDSSTVMHEYPAINYDKFLQIASMPSFPDDEGIVVLLCGDSLIDEFAYNTKMHFALISYPEGVSLERIDPDRTTQDATNWHSAAESYGYATPANRNSQFRKLSENIEDAIATEPETFSPNSDGYDDVVFIRYKFDEPGYVANVSIYDGKGRLIRRIASNELLAVEGAFSWDGLNENGNKVNIGIYVIYFEVFNLQGIVKKYKKVCVVADRLK